MALTPEVKKQLVGDFLQGLHDQALHAFKKGNLRGAAYMASVYGMWTNCARLPDHNPFKNDDILLYRWFDNGYDDFSQAIRVSREIRAKILAKEETDALEKQKKGKK